jgi:hypothetical protein
VKLPKLAPCPQHQFKKCEEGIMKNIGKLILTAAAVLALALNISTCSKSGSSGVNNSGETPIASYSTTTQAAAAVSTVATVMNVIQTLTQNGSLLDLSTLTGASFSPRFAVSHVNGYIGTIDSVLRKMAEQTNSLSKAAPIMQEVLKKTSALEVVSINTTTNCKNGGSFTLDVTKNDDGSGTGHVIFSNCRDENGIPFTSGINVEANGTYDVVILISGSAKSQRETFNFTQNNYTDNTFASRYLEQALNYTVSKIVDITSGSVFTDGSTVTTQLKDGTTNVVTFTKIGKAWTSTNTPSDGSNTKVTDASGSISYNRVNKWMVTVSVDLHDKIQSMNDADNTRKEWLNGSQTITWSPADAISTEDCVPGLMVISMPDTDPFIYNNTWKTCPGSGTMTVNNTTWQCGTSGGVDWPGNVVTIDGVSQTFFSCDQLKQQGAVCNGSFLE